jgi:hypothetical protein
MTMKGRIRRLEGKLSIKRKVPQKERIQVIEKDDPEKMGERIKHIQTKLLEKYGTLEGTTFVISNIKREALPGDFTNDRSLQGQVKS